MFTAVLPALCDHHCGGHPVVADLLCRTVLLLLLLLSCTAVLPVFCHDDRGGHPLVADLLYRTVLLSPLPSFKRVTQLFLYFFTIIVAAIPEGLLCPALLLTRCAINLLLLQFVQYSVTIIVVAIPEGLLCPALLLTCCAVLCCCCCSSSCTL
jgi:magnesium-transporting ATPase (P-type)